MSKRAKGTVIHGMINIMLPFVLVLLHSGVFAGLFGDNPWKFFFVGVSLAVLPIISSAAGILISGILLLKSREKMIGLGLLLSAIGLAEQLVFRFVLRI